MAGGTPNVKHLWIQDPSGIGDPAKVSEAVPEYPGSVGKVGNLKEATGVRTKVLQYVLRASTDTTVAAAAGALAYVYATSGQDNFIVCADQTLALGGNTAPIPAGVFLGTLPSAGSYGYVQVAGTANLLQAGVNAIDVVAGDQFYVAAADSDGKVLIPVWTTAGCTTAADVAASVLVQRQARVGHAITAQTDSTVSVPVLLTFAHNGW